MTANLDLPIAASVGPYRILGRLGGGGMGVIYRAVHAETGLAAAVKTVRFPRRTNVSSIRIEIHTLSRLQNPGVVRILDQGIEAGLPWYAMELLEGTTLRDWLDSVWPEIKTIRAAGGTPTGTPSHSSEVDTLVEHADADGAVPPQPARARPRVRVANGRLIETLRTFAKVCAPLAFIHGEGIVHRDLKPPNVFLRDDGRPVLVDFGLASMFRGAVGRETLEVSGELMGTVAYISPEQVRAEMVDARSDLYALGCMLYEALTGQVPFSARSPRETVSRHLYQWPPLPSELASGISPSLERVVLSLLEKNPADRIGHADDLAETRLDLAAAEERGGAGSAPRAPAPAPAE
ncbi:MAG TPA: serine/threonine-protein kinase, partial [Polyangia bacterium]|nr:serine/threonine-protein kinase [Polyangia bacterium]